MSQPRARRVRFVVILAASAMGSLLALSAPSAALAAKAKKACPTAGATVAQNAFVRVYTKPNAEDIDPVYACELKKGRPFKLDGNKGPECQNNRRVRNAVLAGTKIALQITDCEQNTAFEYLSVWDAAKRKLIRKADAGDFPTPAPAGDPPPDGFTDISSLVLKANGAVAWIGIGGYNVNNSVDDVEVRRITAAGKNELLDSGSDIVRTSLALASNGTLYWAKGSVLRSGVL